MRYIIATAIVFLIMSARTSAQTKPAPCTAPECSQFSFWLGEWRLTYNDTAHASNSITLEMNGCLIHEHFHDPSNGYAGESWSMYNAAKKRWQQTWVDNQGAYITLEGTFLDGRMILYTEPALQPDGTKKQNRMMFYNIAPDQFDWDWDLTTDGGKTWQNKWRIHYTRK